jgi:hypothetical protein
MKFWKRLCLRWKNTIDYYGANDISVAACNARRRAMFYDWISTFEFDDSFFFRDKSRWLTLDDEERITEIRRMKADEAIYMSTGCILPEIDASWPIVKRFYCGGIVAYALWQIRIDGTVTIPSFRHMETDMLFAAYRVNATNIPVDSFTRLRWNGMARRLNDNIWLEHGSWVIPGRKFVMLSTAETVSKLIGFHEIEWLLMNGLTEYRGYYDDEAGEYQIPMYASRTSYLDAKVMLVMDYYPNISISKIREEYTECSTRWVDEAMKIVSKRCRIFKPRYASDAAFILRTHIRDACSIKVREPVL